MLIDAPRIIQTTRQLTALIYLSVPREEIRNVINPCLSEITSVLADQGIEPTGRWFTHHLRIDPDNFDFELCLPVDKRIARQGRVEAGEWPAMTVARTIFQGPYGRLPAAWAEFNAWAAANGHTPAEDRWERHHPRPPGLLPRIELSRPLVV